jgi:hypothetical protein
MSTLLPAVREYLDLRRSFGYVLAGQDRPLADFAGYLERIGAETVTIAAALAWAVEPATTPLRHSQRLAMVRGFATYLHAIDPGCEIPPKDLLPEGRRRVPPQRESSPAPSVPSRDDRDGHWAPRGHWHALR